MDPTQWPAEKSGRTGSDFRLHSIYTDNGYTLCTSIRYIIVSLTIINDFFFLLCLSCLYWIGELLTDVKVLRVPTVSFKTIISYHNRDHNLKNASYQVAIE